MEGTKMQAPARLACVVRDFLGSRLERELLGHAFALAWREPVATEREPDCSAATGLDRAPQRKGA